MPSQSPDDRPPASFIKTLRATAKSARRRPPPGYVVSFDAPRPDLPRIEERSWPGLLLYHVVAADDGSRRLVSYWDCRDSFQAMAPEFAEILGVEGPCHEGFAAQYRGHRDPFWKRAAFWYGVLLHLVALFGALQGLEGVSGWLLASPQVGLESTVREPVNFLAEGDMELRLRITNENNIGSATVRLAALRLKGADGAVTEELIWQKTPIIVAKASSKEIPVTGSAPAPGLYRLTIAGSVEAGRLRAGKPIDEEIELRTWPLVTWSPLEVESAGAGKCRLRGEVTAGRKPPPGLRAEAVLERHASVRLFGVRGFPNVTTWPDPVDDQTPGKEVTSLVWQLSDLTPFKAYPFEILLTGPPETDWARVAEDLALRHFIQQ